MTISVVIIVYFLLSLASILGDIIYVQCEHLLPRDSVHLDKYCINMRNVSS